MRLKVKDMIEFLEGIDPDIWENFEEHENMIGNAYQLEKLYILVINRIRDIYIVGLQKSVAGMVAQFIRPSWKTSWSLQDSLGLACQPLLRKASIFGRDVEVLTLQFLQRKSGRLAYRA